MPRYRRAMIRDIANYLYYKDEGTQENANNARQILSELRLYRGDWGLDDWMDGREPHPLREKFDEWLWKRIEEELDKLYATDTESFDDE